MSKEIKIRKKNILFLIISIIVGFGILYTFEHFGEFNFLMPSTNTEYNSKGQIKMYSEQKLDAKVRKIYYTTYFGNTVETDGNGFTIGDMMSYGDFNNYENKSYYYTKAMFKDYLYGLYFSLAIFLIFIFFSYFKIKFT